MNKSIFIVGTNTDIGKTFVSAGIVRALKQIDINIGYFKPVQSGVSKKKSNQLSDVDFVKKIADLKQDVKEMNVYSFEEPLSPHLAAKKEKVIVDKKLIIQKYSELKNQYDYLVIEGAGGVIVPLSNDYYIYDLIKDMKCEATVVADSKVGTINQTCLTVDFLKSQGITVNGIIINKYTGNFYEDDNIKMIEKRSGVKVKAILEDINVENKKLDFLRSNDYEFLIKQQYDKNLDKNIAINLF